jgi:alpha-methylacyl-CoA racemase
MAMSGPLHGIRVLELGGIGPVPFAGMLLADLGAEVLRIERVGPSALGTWTDPRYDVLARGRRSVALDLKHARAVEIVSRLVARSDALIEGFRPGVAERMGLGPDACAGWNPRLVYGRMTGWGAAGPRAQTAGHDINYISVAGALHAIGPANGPPVVPLNLIGDFGGGALYLALGVVSALLETRASGKGQVVDAAMVDGVASLMAALHGAHAIGFWQDRRGSNLLDGAAPYYGVYETKDGKHMAVGAIEPAFYAELVTRLGLNIDGLPGQFDRDQWAPTREIFAGVFLTKTQAEWCAVFDGTDACVTPVLSMAAAAVDVHLRERGTFVDLDGVVQPAPAPRFSRTSCAKPASASQPGAHSVEVLKELGYADAEISALGDGGAVRWPEP